MPKDKEERRKERRTDRRTDRRARIKKKLPASINNGTVQRLREARKEIKELKAKLATYEVQTELPPAQDPDFAEPDHPPMGAVTPIGAVTRE